MAVSGVGIDLVEVSRIEEAVGRFGDRFLERVYTEDELAYCLERARPHVHLAARFAAKEAISKALGTGWRGFSWRDIEISNDELGAPRADLCGRAAKILAKSGGARVLLSISHTKDLAMAQVIIVSSK